MIHDASPRRNVDAAAQAVFYRSTPMEVFVDSGAQGVTLVVPVYNEEASLPQLLPQLLDQARSRGWRIVFVDDGSTDGGGRLLAEVHNPPHVEVIRLRVNRGYGGALKAGIGRVTTAWVVTVDADGQHRADQIDRLVEHAIAEEADLVIGTRRRTGWRGLYRALGKWMIRILARVLLSCRLGDLNSGFRVYRTKLARHYLPLCPDTMAFSDVIALLFLSERHLVLELPVEVAKRLAGRSKVNTWTAVETVREIVNVLMLFHPSRVFFPMAGIAFLGALGWGVPLIVLGRGVSVGALLAFVAGSFLVVTGLLAEQLSLTRRQLLGPSPPALDAAPEVVATRASGPNAEQEVDSTT
jgi:hypothetical protein